MYFLTIGGSILAAVVAAAGTGATAARRRRAAAEARAERERRRGRHHDAGTADHAHSIRRRAAGAVPARAISSAPQQLPDEAVRRMHAEALYVVHHGAVAAEHVQPALRRLGQSLRRVGHLVEPDLLDAGVRSFGDPRGRLLFGQLEHGRLDWSGQVGEVRVGRVALHLGALWVDGVGRLAPLLESLVGDLGEVLLGLVTDDGVAVALPEPLALRSHGLCPPFLPSRGFGAAPCVPRSRSSRSSCSTST